MASIIKHQHPNHRYVGKWIRLDDSWITREAISHSKLYQIQRAWHNNEVDVVVINDKGEEEICFLGCFHIEHNLSEKEELLMLISQMKQECSK